MADQLFYTYNSSGVSAKAIKASNDHSYSIVFDTNRRSILAQGKEFGYTNIIGNAKGTNNGVSDVSIDSNGNITITYSSFLPGNTVIPNVSGFTYDDVFTLGSNTASSKTKIGTGYKTSGTSTSAYTASDIYETNLSVDTTKGTSSQYVYATSVNGHKITNSYKNLPTLGLGSGSAPTSNKVMQNMTVSDHTITPSYVTIATYEYLGATYQPVGNYQPSGIYTTITGINTKNTSTGYQINITYSGGSYSDYIPAATSTTFGVIKKTKDYHYTPDVLDTSNTVFSSGTTASSTGAAFGSTIFVSGVSIGKDSKGHIVSLGTTTYTLPSETTLSLASGTARASNQVVSGIGVNNHTITQSYMTIATYDYLAATYQPVGNYLTQDVWLKPQYSTGLYIGKGYKNTTAYNAVNTYVPIMTINTLGVGKATWTADGTITTSPEYGGGNIDNEYRFLPVMVDPDGTLISVGKTMTADRTYGLTKIYGSGSGYVNINSDGFLTYAVTDLSNYITYDLYTSIDLSSSNNQAGYEISIGDVEGELGISTIIPVMTTSTYGVAMAYHSRLTANKNVQSATTTTDRYYGIQLNKEGKLVVNVPWTNVNNDYVDWQSWSFVTLSGKSESDGYSIFLQDPGDYINASVTIPLMSSSSYGVAYSYYNRYTTNVKVESSSTDANRWYGIRPNKDGKLVVNVPWTNINNDYVTKTELSNQSYVKMSTFNTLLLSGSSESTGYSVKLGDDSFTNVDTDMTIPPMTSLSYGVAKAKPSGSDLSSDTNFNKIWIDSNGILYNSVSSVNETSLSLGSTIGGTGKAITALSVSGTANHTITATYSTFLTSHASHSIDFTGSQVSGTQSSGTINVLVGINDTSASSGTISCTYKYKTISLDGTGGGSAANCVTYTSETNAIKTITVASSPGTDANVLYVIL